jgi:hypothetical protein
MQEDSASKLPCSSLVLTTKDKFSAKSVEQKRNAAEPEEPDPLSLPELEMAF